jgi:hypothetical protein
MNTEHKRGMNGNKQSVFDEIRVMLERPMNIMKSLSWKAKFVIAGICIWLVVSNFWVVAVVSAAYVILNKPGFLKFADMPRSEGDVGVRTWT